MSDDTDLSGLPLFAGLTEPPCKPRRPRRAARKAGKAVEPTPAPEPLAATELPPAPPSNVAVFPTTRNRARLRRTVAFMLSVPSKHAEGHAREQLRRLASGLERRGIPAELIQREVDAYAAAIRAEYWRAAADQAEA